jgi:DNA-binding response OmpR family regulator
LRLIDSDGAAFAAIVTDVRLPGADGWQIARHAREVFTDIPIVYMSGDSASDWSIEGVPNSLMLQKPFAMAQLVTGLATIMNSASAIHIATVA